MGIKQLYNDNLRKLPNEYGDVSVMFRQGINQTIYEIRNTVCLTKSVSYFIDKTKQLECLRFQLLSSFVGSIRGVASDIPWVCASTTYLPHTHHILFIICEQQRRRSACASAQSDQRLYCSLPR